MSGGVNDGTAVGAPILKGTNDCVSGKCLSFNGSTDYVNCGAGSGLDLSTSFTFCLWVNPTIITSGTRTVFYRGDTSVAGGYALNQEANKFKVYYYDTAWRGTSLSTTSATTDNWYYIVGTYDKKNLVLYVNGLKECVTPYITSISQPTGAVLMMGEVASGVQKYNGLIDDARIYNTPLSSSQIKQNYVVGLNSMLANGNISKEEYNQRIESLASNIK